MKKKDVMGVAGVAGFAAVWVALVWCESIHSVARVSATAVIVIMHLWMALEGLKVK